MSSIDIQEIRRRFTIYDFILWSTLICFGIIISMIHFTNNNDDSRKCLVYEGDKIDIVDHDGLSETEKDEK
jgi:hypothetical protein